MSITKKTTKVFRIIVIALILILLGLHFVNLDADPPAWGVGFYQPVDEGPYAYMAINQRIYDTPNPSEELTGGFTSWISENFIMNPVGNLFNWIGFKIFGNNYYGLRVPYVFLFLINFFLLFLLLNHIRKRYCKNGSDGINTMLLVILWMTLDFSLSLASRYVEPSLVRMTFTLLACVIYLYLPNSERLRYFLLGAIITFSVFLVYITNFFLFLAAGVVLLYVWVVQGWKKFWKYVAWFSLGCAVVFALAEAYYIGFWGTEAIKNSIAAVTSFSEDAMAGVYSSSDSGSLITTIALSVIRIFSANSFIYSIPILFAFFPVVPVVFRSIKNNKDQELLFMIMIVLSFFAQGLISYDTFTRKFVIVFPILICIMYATFISRDNQMIANKIQRIKGMKSRSTFIRKNYENSIKILLGIAVLFSVAVYIYRFYLFDQTYMDYDLTTNVLLLILELIPLIVFFILEMRFISISSRVIKGENPDKEENIKEITEKYNKRRSISIGVIIVLMCIFNLVLNIRYLWATHNYSERDAMIAMADVVDDQYILGGGFQLGYTLYTNMKPVVTNPKETMKQLKAAPETLIIEYENEEKYFGRTYYKNSEYRFVPFWVIERNFKAFGNSHNMCLYHAVDYDDYYQYLRDRAAMHENDAKDPDEEDHFAYPLQKTDLYGHSLKTVVFTDIEGNVFGNVTKGIYGNISGSVYGAIDGDIHGNIGGSVFGDINGTVYGDIKGFVFGKINGSVEGTIGGVVTSDGAE